MNPAEAFAVQSQLGPAQDLVLNIEKSRLCSMLCFADCVCLLFGGLMLVGCVEWFWFVCWFAFRFWVEIFVWVFFSFKLFSPPYTKNKRWSTRDLL